MANLVLKWRYIRHGNPRHAAYYIKYIATREGVEKCDASWKGEPATREQERLIKQLLRDFPNMKDSKAYTTYCREPTKYTASVLIDSAIDENADRIAKKENYIDYIAKRPRVEKLGTHGLFSQEDTPLHLVEIAKEVAAHKGLVWTTIISLRREDAARLGYDNAKGWQQLLRRTNIVLAEAMGVSVSELKWYAAFHNEGDHPHIHLVSYSTGKEPYLTEEQLLTWKKKLAKEVFKQDRERIYTKQIVYRDELRKYGRDIIAALIAEMKAKGVSDNKAGQLLLKLREQLTSYTGKPVYGYLPQECKRLVDSIVEELAKDERMQKLYDLWYEQKELLTRQYTDRIPNRVPLSRNNNFKSIRNAVIREALGLHDETPHERNTTRTCPTREQPQDRAVTHTGAAATGVLRLFGYLSHMIEDNMKNDRNSLDEIAVDRKLLREINEKKQRHGIKQG